MDTEKTIDSALGTLTTVAFTIPGGQPLAAGLAIADFFVKLFYPDAPPTPPAPATAQEMKKELADLLSKIVDALWKQTADNIADRLLGINDTLLGTWSGMQALGINGQTFELNGLDKPTRKWITGTDLYFMLNASPVLTDLVTYQGHFTKASLNDPSLDPLTRAEHRTAHTAVYCLVGSLMVAYLKMKVAWDWGWDILLNGQYQAYQAALDDWNARPASYQAKHPYANLIQTLDGQYPYLHFDSYAVKDWNGYLKDPGCAAGSLTVKVGELLDYCVTGTDHPLFTTMNDDWDALEKLVAGYDVTPASSTGVTAAELAAAVSKGAQRAFDWPANVEKHALVGVTEDDLDRFARCIAHWRAASASVRFVVYTVKAGDTLASLAKANYGDATMTKAIYDNNRDRLTDPNVLPVGAVLKIFDKSALPDLDAAAFDPNTVGA